jgi:hypothetical protein
MASGDVMRVYNGLERVWNEMGMSQFKVYYGIWLEGLRKTTVNYSQDSHCPGQDSTSVPLKYDLEALPLD